MIEHRFIKDSTREVATSARMQVAMWVVLSLSVALLTLVADVTLARSTDRDEPINIEADRAEADEKSRVTIYRGDAIIVQGTLRITGDKIEIYLNEEDQFVKLVSVGRPASMRQLPDDSEVYRTAKAKRLEYFADRDLIVLLGDAQYGQGADQISADRIEYDSRRGRMRARAKQPEEGAADGAAPTDRIKIVIQPKKQNSE